LVKALTGKSVGEKAEVFMAGKLQELEIISIKY
jgi:transcription elongation factor GreB